MRYLEASPHLRLRPSHLLLMVYRYHSGVYQVGDLWALNYVKGYLDGRAAGRDLGSVLTVSGHGIGEAEMWMADRLPGSEIHTMSFRLIDTQLLQFLRAATPDDIERVFARFGEMVTPFPTLAALASDTGLVPYWEEQADAIKRSLEGRTVMVFSDSPVRIPAGRLYDLIYVSQAAPHFSLEAAERLRRHLTPQGLLAILMAQRPDHGPADAQAPQRFADSGPVRQAKKKMRDLLAQWGYAVERQEKPFPDLSPLPAHRERIIFSVLAPAGAVLVGQLILASLNEHVSDRDRLKVLDSVSSQFTDLNVPVTEELELLTIEPER